MVDPVAAHGTTFWFMWNTHISGTVVCQQSYKRWSSDSFLLRLFKMAAVTLKCGRGLRNFCELWWCGDRTSCEAECSGMAALLTNKHQRTNRGKKKTTASKRTTKQHKVECRSNRVLFVTLQIYIQQNCWCQCNK